MSEQAMLEMVDAATNPPTASTVFTSLWQAESGRVSAHAVYLVGARAVRRGVQHHAMTPGLYVHITGTL